MFNQNLTFAGLGTVSVTVPEASNYFVEGKSSIPTLTNGGGVSALVAVVNKNGSPVYTGSAGAEGFYTNVLCAANDVISVVYSSANAVDAGLNVVKSTIALGTGV